MKRVLIVLMWFCLIISAIVVLLAFVLPAFIVGVFSKFFRRKIGNALDEFSSDLRGVAVVVDFMGNVTIFNWLWFLFKKSEGYKFGNYHQTISEVLHLNFKTKTLTWFGLAIYNSIKFLDRKHFECFEIIKL